MVADAGKLRADIRLSGQAYFRFSADDSSSHDPLLQQMEESRR